MDSIKVDIVFDPNSSSSKIISCELKEFILNLLVFHISNDKFIIFKLDDYDYKNGKTYLRLENKEETIDIYFYESKFVSQIIQTYEFIQNSNLKEFMLNKDFPTLTVCNLNRCIKIDQDVHKHIEGVLEDENICKLLKSSLVRFSNFMLFILNHAKGYLIDKLTKVDDYEIYMYVLGFHKEIYNLFGFENPEISFKFLDNLRQKVENDFVLPSFYFTVEILEKDLLVRENDFQRYAVISGKYLKFTKSLQTQKVDLFENRLILNSESEYYPFIFHYFMDNSRHLFHFLDVEIFFKVYRNLLIGDKTKLIYLNDGIFRLIDKCADGMILNEEEADFFYCTCRTSFYNETELINFFFIFLYSFIDEIVALPDICVVNLLESLTTKKINYNMKDIYLNTQILDLLNVDEYPSAKYALSVIKLLGKILINLDCPRLNIKSKKILMRLQGRYENTGLGSTIGSYLVY